MNPAGRSAPVPRYRNGPSHSGNLGNRSVFPPNSGTIKPPPGGRSVAESKGEREYMQKMKELGINPGNALVLESLKKASMPIPFISDDDVEQWMSSYYPYEGQGQYEDEIAFQKARKEAMLKNAERFNNYYPRTSAIMSTIGGAYTAATAAALAPVLASTVLRSSLKNAFK